MVGWIKMSFGLEVAPFGGVITGVLYNVSACNAHKSVDNTCVSSCVFITLLCNNYFPQKFITHKDLESLLHSFPSSPAVVCGGLRFSDLLLLFSRLLVFSYVCT